MKVARIYSNQQGASTQFGAVTHRMPQFPMKSSVYMSSQYDFFKFAKFYEALDDQIFPNNKFVRRDNFSFLERIPDFLKGTFVDNFKNLTSFPGLFSVSKKIEKHFVDCVKANQTSELTPLLAGYDPTCSVSLNHALPGSDINRAFVIIRKEPKADISDVRLVNQFKGLLWKTVDQRILSLNHKNSFPEVYTLNQFHTNLDILDDLTRNAGLIRHNTYFLNKKDKFIEPFEAGEFNIRLAKANQDQYYISREAAKNFAYFIEAVRDGKIVYSKEGGIESKILQRIRYSPFAQMSNLTQTRTIDKLISSGEKKIQTKLKNREELWRDFNGWDVNTQFDLVKDLVRSVSQDQGQRFDHYFRNDYDFSESYAKLNKALV